LRSLTAANYGQNPPPVKHVVFYALKGPENTNSHRSEYPILLTKRRYIITNNHSMAKNVIHISEAEAASDFASLMARVRAGAKVIIENGARPVAVLRAAEPVRRSISESIALAKAHEDETGKAPVLDQDFAEDVEEILSHRKPWNPPAWE